jgi:hypothetical protein
MVCHADPRKLAYRHPRGTGLFGVFLHVSLLPCLSDLRTGNVLAVDSRRVRAVEHAQTYHAGAAANALSAAGTTLATATVLAAQFNAVATVAAGSGVALPNVIGVPIWVFNNQATNALLVYPFSASQTINALAAGAGFSLAAAGKIQLVQVATNVWYTMT